MLSSAGVRRRWAEVIVVGAAVAAACSSPTRDFSETPSDAGSGGTSDDVPRAQSGNGNGGTGSNGQAGSTVLPSQSGNATTDGGDATAGGAAGAELQPSACAPNPCKNGGACAESGTDFTCDCAPGFGGSVCEGALLEPLPALDGSTECTVAALNGNGGVAVGRCSALAGDRAFWWKPSRGSVALTEEGARSAALGVSRDGTVVVGNLVPDSGVSFGMRWVNGVAGQNYRGLIYDDEPASAAIVSVSDDGAQLIGRSESSNGSPRGVRWQDGEAVTMGNGFGEIYPMGASSDATVVAGYAYDRSAALRWTLEGGWLALPPGPDTDSLGRGISRDGKVIVGGVDGRAVRWLESGAPEDLGIVGMAEGADEHGDVIVGASGGAAMFWTKAAGARILQDVLYELSAETLSGWVLTSADAVSATGLVIAGRGTLNGKSQMWLARLPTSALR